VGHAWQAIRTVPQYFDDPSELASDPRTVAVTLADIAYTYVTDRGVFSHGHLDEGTALLLQEAPPPAAAGNLLDLGCGAGPIALAMALRSPAAQVWAVDVNPRAVDLTTANAHRAGVRVCAVTPAGLPPDIRFATIWSNPPIRVGKSALHAMLTSSLARLAGGGRAVLVVNRHLGADSLQRWLIDAGWDVDRLASRRGFRLLEVRHPADRDRDPGVRSADRVDGDAQPPSRDPHT
jgi:16S rRNA G1207 methylase RsmC